MLHVVNVTIPIYIYLANDEPSNRLERLREIAEEGVKEDMDSASGWSYHSTQVENLHEVSKEWRDAIPFGDHDIAFTCKQILDRKKTEKDINELVLTALVGLQNNGIDSVGITDDGCGLSVKVNGAEWEIKMVKKREYK